jgi:hypothetical protein
VLLNEILRRRLATEQTAKFTEYTTPRWTASKIHRIVCEQLDRVARREIDRLMLLCPPQHGKSSIASKRFPALMLGRDPTIDVISASATGTLAEGFGREVRNTVDSPEYRRLFPATTLAEDSQAKGLWNTSAGGSYYAVGFGGALLGRGGDGGVIDDPFATWEEAQSEIARDRAWNWYQGTFYNRIRPGGWIILIQHRMHESDVAGRLIEKQKAGGDRWEIVELPALLDDPPWPERYDRAALERIKANTSPMQWSSLYLQNPVPEQGTFFQREWFWFYDPAKRIAGNRYTTADFAVTADKGDWTEVATHVYAPGGRLYLAVDGWRGQTAADTWIEVCCDQFREHEPFCFFGETGVIRRAIEPFLTRRMRERRTVCRLEWITRTHDKAATARALQGMASMGLVGLPDNDYGHHLLRQFLGFPASQLDDAVDMAALMALAIDQAHPGVLARPEKAEKRDAYGDDDDDEYEEVTWRTA